MGGMFLLEIHIRIGIYINKNKKKGKKKSKVMDWLIDFTGI